MLINLLNILSFIALALIFLGLIVAGALFKKIEERNSKYYKDIGKPSILINSALSPTWDQFINVKNAIIYSYTLAFRGLPKSFPSDNTLRRWALITRIVFILITITFMVTFSVIIMSMTTGS